MCAFSFPKGGENLNNQKFKLLSEAKRQQKLAAILRFGAQRGLLQKGSQDMCFRRQAPIYQVPMPPPVTPDNEADLIRRAFGLIQRRINEHLAGAYPEARWIWETPNAQARIIAGEPVHIMLNRAGGYRRAEVQVIRLQFKGLVFEPVPMPEPIQLPEGPPGEPDETDYSLLAFEWVESHVQELNQRGNEIIAQGKSEICIAADELPDPASWPDICIALKHSGFSEAVITETGITTKTPH